MPPKKNRLGSLLDKAKKAESKKGARPKRKKASRPPKVLTVKPLEKKIREDKAINNFLEQLIDNEHDDELIENTRIFASGGPDLFTRQMRAKFFFGPTGPARLLDPSQYREFIVAYLAQPTERIIRTNVGGEIQIQEIKLPTKGLKDFWNLYLEKPDIRNKIEERADELQDEQNEMKLLEQALAKIVLEEEIDEDPTPALVEEPTVRPGPRTYRHDEALGWIRGPSKKREIPRTAIMVEVQGYDDQGKPILEKTTIPKKPKTKFVKQQPFRRCIQEQRTVPWLEGNVTNIYIRPVNISSKMEKYIHRNRSIKVDLTTGPREGKDKEFFLASNNFFQLMCKNDSRLQQEGEVLHIPTAEGSIGFYVVYQIKNRNGKVMNKIRNEKLVEKKAQWYAQKNQTEEQKINMLLNGPVTSLITDVCTGKIADRLRQIAPLNKNYIDNKFAQEVSDLIATQSTTVKQYIGRIASILSYLNLDGSPILRERVKQGWYSARAFVHLTPQQFFPEAVQDSKTASELVRRKDRIAKRLAYTYYLMMNPAERVPTRPEPMIMTRDIKTKRLRDHCENQDDPLLEGVPDYRLVPYEENEKLYCLDVDQIKRDIELFDGVDNPFTDKELDAEWLADLKKTFDALKSSNKQEKEEEKEESQDAPPDEKNMLAPGLMALVIGNIAKCHQELQEEEGKKCDAMENITPKEDDSDSDSDSDIPPPPDKKSAMNGGDKISTHKCAQCGKATPKNDIRTIVKTKNGYEEKHFCPENNIKCLEKYKLSKAGKKGGRKGPQDHSTSP